MAVFELYFRRKARECSRGTRLRATPRFRSRGASTRLRARYYKFFEIAMRADGATHVKVAGMQIGYLSVENGYPIGTDLSLARTFYGLIKRMFGAVYFANNELADSSTDLKGRERGGLSPLGNELVAECNQLGLVLVASLAHDFGGEQLLELSAPPIIRSHSGCAGVAPARATFPTTSCANPWRRAAWRDL